TRWLESLGAMQREVATFPFPSDDRYVWDYRPDGFGGHGQMVRHRGLRLVNMTHAQQALALALFDIGLSARGAGQARRIMPPEVRHGPERGARALPEEEDLARALLGALDAEQQRVAIVNPVAPRDIFTDVYRVADPNAVPAGLRLDAMRGEQRERLVGLVRHY